jgi:hypothetical protein
MKHTIAWEMYLYHKTKREELWASDNKKEALMHGKFEAEALAFHNNIDFIIGPLTVKNCHCKPTIKEVYPLPPKRERKDQWHIIRK